MVGIRSVLAAGLVFLGSCSPGEGGAVVTVVPDELWGFADLHAHPAFHLAYGAKSDGTGGLVWGLAGAAFTSSAATISSDLAMCKPDRHGADDGNLERGTVLQEMNQATGAPHG